MRRQLLVAVVAILYALLGSSRGVRGRGHAAKREGGDPHQHSLAQPTLLYCTAAVPPAAVLPPSDAHSPCTSANPPAPASTNHPLLSSAHRACLPSPCAVASPLAAARLPLPPAWRVPWPLLLRWACAQWTAAWAPLRWPAGSGRWNRDSTCQVKEVEQDQHMSGPGSGTGTAHVR